MSLFYNKTLRDSLQELRAFIWWKENLTCFVSSPSVGVEHFWVGLDERHVFALVPSVGVVHMWVVCM
jgi:hypothetical protein